MRNDLNRLQIRCVNAGQGCEVVCSLESLHTHEDECEFAFVSCSNTGMTPHTDRNAAHLMRCFTSSFDSDCKIQMHKGNMTPMRGGAAGGSFVVMATPQTSAPMGLAQDSHTQHFKSVYVYVQCIQTCSFMLTM